MLTLEEITSLPFFCPQNSNTFTEFTPLSPFHALLKNFSRKYREGAESFFWKHQHPDCLGEQQVSIVSGSDIR